MGDEEFLTQEPYGDHSASEVGAVRAAEVRSLRDELTAAHKERDTLRDYINTVGPGTWRKKLFEVIEERDELRVKLPKIEKQVLESIKGTRQIRADFEKFRDLANQRIATAKAEGLEEGAELTHEDSDHEAGTDTSCLKCGLAVKMLVLAGEFRCRYRARKLVEGRG